ncbi:MAG: mannose-6-phosphate isomerase, class I [Candidatus Cloacimonetes bacterium]|nr:mannose-6-phosphate isomerase, class I [Candidatus Cloacimonadota bacterium]
MNYIDPVLHNYAWGSHTFIQQFLNIEHPEPLAEAWYSAHPQAPSMVGKTPLDVLIKQNPEYWLGSINSKLPFLLKVLAADQALSLQVHPSKKQAEEGFIRENDKQIPIDAPQRNYRDDNHKPEMIMALTDFYAMCGFRNYNDIIMLFKHFKLGTLFSTYQYFAKDPSPDSFQAFYQEILERKPMPQLAEHILKLHNSDRWENELKWTKYLLSLYPEDCTAISPLLLNLIHLKPFQAIFLESRIVHAYLQGAGIEIMAASDNVLRAGLSPKHIDVEELLKVMRYSPYQPTIYPAQNAKQHLIEYSNPTSDFLLSRVLIDSKYSLPNKSGVRILLNLDGDCTLLHKSEEIHLKKGSAVILPSAKQDISIIGNAHIIMASDGTK